MGWLGSRALYCVLNMQPVSQRFQTVKCCLNTCRASSSAPLLLYSRARLWAASRRRSSSALTGSSLRVVSSMISSASVPASAPGCTLAHAVASRREDLFGAGSLRRAVAQCQQLHVQQSWGSVRQARLETHRSACL